MVFVDFIGRYFLIICEQIGSTTRFIMNSLVCCFTPPFYWRQMLSSMWDIGFCSLPVVGGTALFTGMVLALQTSSGFSRFSAEQAIPTVVVLSITRELAPVMTGLMVAGRISSSIAAEIASMQVTEQIGALLTLAVSPRRYLVAPRLWAGVICLPMLVTVADAIGVFGGYLVGVYKLRFNSASYIEQTFKYLLYTDFISGVVKATFFGFALVIVGAFCGFNAGSGATGVGKATTKAVVASSITILLINYLLTELLF